MTVAKCLPVNLLKFSSLGSGSLGIVAPLPHMGGADILYYLAEATPTSKVGLSRFDQNWVL